MSYGCNNKSYPGIFVSFEGVDGCGKSTQLAQVASCLKAQGRAVTCVREPGGTTISEKIRALLLDVRNRQMADECELLLYEASRAQLVHEVIKPALMRGDVVLCDRFFDSTFAYQAVGRGLDKSLVNRANELGSCGLVPTRTLVLDLDVFEAYARATQGEADRLEQEGVAFQERVRAGFMELVRGDIHNRFALVDARGSQDEVFARVCAALADVPGLEDLASTCNAALHNKNTPEQPHE